MRSFLRSPLWSLELVCCLGLISGGMGDFGNSGFFLMIAREMLSFSWEMALR